MSTVHVVPINDLIEHSVPGGLCRDAAMQGWLAIEAIDESTGECVCLPSTEHVSNVTGPDGWIVVHHSLDGREQQEQR